MHLMIREGAQDVTLAYLAKHRNMLAVSMFSDGQSTPLGEHRGGADEAAWLECKGDAADA